MSAPKIAQKVGAVIFGVALAFGFQWIIGQAGNEGGVTPISAREPSKLSVLDTKSQQSLRATEHGRIWLEVLKSEQHLLADPEERREILFSLLSGAHDDSALSFDEAIEWLAETSPGDLCVAFALPIDSSDELRSRLERIPESGRTRNECLKALGRFLSEIPDLEVGFIEEYLNQGELQLLAKTAISMASPASAEATISALGRFLPEKRQREAVKSFIQNIQSPDDLSLSVRVAQQFGLESVAYGKFATLDPESAMKLLGEHGGGKDDKAMGLIFGLGEAARLSPQGGELLRSVGKHLDLNDEIGQQKASMLVRAAMGADASYAVELTRRMPDSKGRDEALMAIAAQANVESIAIAHQFLKEEYQENLTSHSREALMELGGASVLQDLPEAFRFASTLPEGDIVRSQIFDLGSRIYGDRNRQFDLNERYSDEVAEIVRTEIELRGGL